MKIQTEEISIPIVKEKEVRLFIKRLDKVHPFISGNKWFKLKYNLLEAQKQGIEILLTFGVPIPIILRLLPLLLRKKALKA